jgi:hypothetical protein
LDCQLWGGAVGCDTESPDAELLGLVTISDSSVTYYIKSEWAAISYQLYAGVCPMNDGGKAWSEGTDCVNNRKSMPYDVETYPLASMPLPLEPPNTLWTFNSENQDDFLTDGWMLPETDYQVFDISNLGSTVYMSAHAEICPCIEDTSAPTGKPTMAPTGKPTMAPTDKPTMAPTKEPTKSPTQSPTDAVPTSEPTQEFVPEGTPAPTECIHEPAQPVTPAETTPSPTSVYVGMGTTAPGPTPPAPGCEKAFVYCPGKSTCFEDPIFNCYTEQQGVDPWGWNIHYHSSDGAVDDCEVWVSADACDFSQGQKIGFAVITPASFTIQLDSDVYGTAEYSFQFRFYAGECIGSDGGAHIESGVCLADDVAKYAHDGASYPLITGTLDVTTFTFDSIMQAEPAWGRTYQSFPLGSTDREYLSGNVMICPV